MFASEPIADLSFKHRPRQSLTVTMFGGAPLCACLYAFARAVPLAACRFRQLLATTRGLGKHGCGVFRSAQDFLAAQRQSRFPSFESLNFSSLTVGSERHRRCCFSQCDSPNSTFPKRSSNGGGQLPGPTSERRAELARPGVACYSVARGQPGTDSVGSRNSSPPVWAK